MKSYPPRDYQSLPRLEPPAGYICVIRDVDSDSYRIDKTAQPAVLVAEALAERQGEFGLELVSVLACDDIEGAEARLYREHYATLGKDWLELDDYQLGELRGSFLELYAFHSHYLTPTQSAGQKTIRRSGARDQGPGAAAGGGGRMGQSRRHGVSLSDRVNDFFTHHPGIVITIFLLIMIICLLWLSQRPHAFYGYSMRY